MHSFVKHRRRQFNSLKKNANYYKQSGEQNFFHHGFLKLYEYPLIIHFNVVNVTVTEMSPLEVFKD